jgi:hypothetical protein
MDVGWGGAVDSVVFAVAALALDAGFMLPELVRGVAG